MSKSYDLDESPDAIEELDAFTTAYIKAARNAKPELRDYSIKDIDRSELREIREYCEPVLDYFLEAYQEDGQTIREPHRNFVLEQAGLAFWYTSAGYGMGWGFLDRNSYSRTLGNKLAEEVKDYTPLSFYITEEDTLALRGD